MPFARVGWPQCLHSVSPALSEARLTSAIACEANQTPSIAHSLTPIQLGTAVVYTYNNIWHRLDGQTIILSESMTLLSLWAMVMTVQLSNCSRSVF